MDYTASMDLAPCVFPLSGRVALVAGCSGAAGLAITEVLVAQGAIVYLAGGLVTTSKQRWRLARAGPGSCFFLPALRTSIALSSAFGRYEQRLHILVASAEAMPVLALAHQDFLLQGSGGAEDPAHVLALGRPMASSFFADLSSEGVVVDSIDPELRFGGARKADMNDVVRTALFLCGGAQEVDMSVVVDSIDPELQCGGAQKFDMSDMERTALFLCDLTPFFDLEALPFPTSKL